MDEREVLKVIGYSMHGKYMFIRRVDHCLDGTEDVDPYGSFVVRKNKSKCLKLVEFTAAPADCQIKYRSVFKLEILYKSKYLILYSIYKGTELHLYTAVPMHFSWYFQLKYF